jgi:hypothetical protein
MPSKSPAPPKTFHEKLSAVHDATMACLLHASRLQDLVKGIETPNPQVCRQIIDIYLTLRGQLTPLRVAGTALSIEYNDLCGPLRGLLTQCTFPEYHRAYELARDVSNGVESVVLAGLPPPPSAPFVDGRFAIEQLPLENEKWLKEREKARNPQWLAGRLAEHYADVRSKLLEQSPLINIQEVAFELNQAHDDALKEWRILNATPRVPVPPTPRPRLAIRNDIVYLDDVLVPLDGTVEACEEIRRYLGALLQQPPGQWVSGSEIDKGVRWDRVRKRLPPILQNLIETNRRKGYRLADAAWRK